MSADAELEAAEQRLGRAWLGLEGIADGFEERIHPDDEMFLTARAARAGRARVQYYRDGQEVVRSLRHMLACAGRTLGDASRVLEMACGFGRVTRHLVQEVAPERITAAEILEPAIGFMSETFGVDARLSATDPIDFDAGSDFDLIFVSSLFSHLPRERFVEWLRTLYGALSPTGLLVFSTHGARVIPSISKSSDGFTFVPRSESRGLDTAEYGSTFVRPDVVRALADEAGVTNLVGVDRELWKLQDVFVGSRASLAALESWDNSPYVHGLVDRLLFSDDGRFHIDGWAAESGAGARLQDVRLVVNGQDLAGVELGAAREDVADAWGRPEWIHSGWSLQGKLPPIDPGRHVLGVRARSDAGTTDVFDVLDLDV